MSSLRFVGLFVALCLSRPVQAAENALDLLDSKESYQADFYVSGDKGRYQGQVIHAPGMERRDFAVKDGAQAVILRRDLDAAYLLKPAGRWYVGLSLSAVGALAGGLDQLTVQRTRLSEETINGMRATKYRLRGQGPRNSSFNGHAWFTADGILIKAEGDLVDDKGATSKVETGLSNLRKGPVGMESFTLPKGWFGMDLRSLPADGIAQAVKSLRPLLEGRDAHQ